MSLFVRVMLSIQALSTSTAQSLKYYLDSRELAESGYYLDGSPCQWAGRGAELLGLVGEVTRAHFEAVLNGIHPQTGESLVGRGPGGTRRPGHDFVFSPPKSFSVAAILTRAVDPTVSKLLFDIHQSARSEALGFMESTYAFTRRGPGGAIREQTPNLVIACFDHIRARPTSKSQSGDLQLHSHCVVANLSARADGTWGALDSKPFYLAQKQISRVYNASLRRQLHDHGIETVRTAKGGFEIAGVTEHVKQEFSSRRQQIVQSLAESGLTGAAAAEAATLKTRQAKPQAAIDPASEQRTWTMRAIAAGFDPAEFARRVRCDMARHASQAPTLTTSQERTTESIIRSSGTTLTRDELDRIAARLIAKAKASSPLPARDRDERGRHVVDNLIAAGRIVPVAASVEGKTLYADHRSARDMRKLAAFAKRHHESATFQRCGVAGFIVDRVIRQESTPRTAQEELNRISDSLKSESLSRRQMKRHRRAAEKRAGIRLTESQQSAARVLTRRDRSRMRVLVGGSGTGKTVTIRATAAAYAAAGYRVIGIGKSGPVVRELQLKAGIDESMTYGQYRAYVGENWVVKLAREQMNLGRALVGKPVRRRPALFDKKTVIVVDAAHTFTAAELRQFLRDAKRSVVIFSGSLEEGQGTAFARLARFCRSAVLTDNLRGFGKASLSKPKRVHSADPMAALLEGWVASECRDPAGATIIAPSKRHVNELNAAAQRARVDHGYVDGKRAAESKSGVRFCKGDRVAFTRTSKPLGVANGQTGVVDFIVPAIVPGSRPTLIVKLDEGRRVFVPLSAFESIDLGYATTRARAESVESERAYVLDAPGSRLDRMSKWAEKVTLFSAEPTPSETGRSLATDVAQQQDREGRGLCR